MASHIGLAGGAAPDRIQALGATTLLARPAQPGEIASVIAFLASPKASCITGAVLAGDGDTSGPRITFNKVPEPKIVKNRVHLDLISDTFDADIEGNEFDLIAG
jgi:Enoyl-(Acyl carrier protein) reductase